MRLRDCRREEEGDEKERVNGNILFIHVRLSAFGKKKPHADARDHVLRYTHDRGSPECQIWRVYLAYFAVK